MNAGGCHFLRNGRKLTEISCGNLDIVCPKELSESAGNNVVRFDIGHFFCRVITAQDVQLFCYFVVTISVACCFSTVHIRKFLIVCKNNI